MKTEVFNDEVNKFKKELMRIIPPIFSEMKRFKPVVMVYIYQENSTKQPIGVMPDVDRALSMPVIGKQVASQAIKAMVKQTKPIALAFISEAYAVDKSKSKQTRDEMIDEIRDAGGVENHPDSQEVLIISLETHCMECNIKYTIDRDSDKPKLELMDEPTWEEKGEHHGVMQNFITECYVDIDEGTADLSKLN